VADGHPLDVDAASAGSLSWTLEETISLLTAALESIHDPVVILNLERRVVRYNHAYLETFGLTGEELTTRGFDALLEAAGRVLADPGEVRALWQTPPDRAVRDTLHFVDGRVFERHISPHRSGERIIGRVITYRDITASMRAERALEEHWSLLEKAQEVAQIGSWVAEIDGTARLEWSRETHRIFGLAYPSFGSTFEAFYDYVHPDDRNAVREIGRRAVESGEPFDIEHRIVRADGELRWIHERAEPVWGADGRLKRLVGTIQDITGRRRFEEEARQSQKLEAIGRLAGGVAHDLNNALTSIVGYTELALNSLGADHEARPDVLEIRRAAGRAESVTRQLLAFSRKQPLQPRVFALGDVVAGIARMLDRFLGERVELIVDVGAEVPPICGDPGQIEQAVVNLAVNARDAMPEGGRLGLTVSAVAVEARTDASHDPIPEGRYVELAVQDTGAGMTPEIKAHIFEPFFTTKDAGKGTGLGLAMVYGTVKQSGGFISVESEVGHGTTFRLRFPPAEVPLAATSDESKRGTAAATPRTVLVVEDETAVRNLVMASLGKRGYRVLAAASGQEALTLVKAEGGAIDLLLTDANMPGMTGIELVSALLAEKPSLPVIVMSGFTEDLPRLVGFEDQITLLPKPFTPKELRDRVGHILS
jgi:two-component system cell cycle sensor histidine kinase/response regulator CckA